MKKFAVRGFNLCESILRHTPDQLRTFIRRMKSLGMNTLIVHYDYGWKRYHDLILEECRAAEIEVTLMTFGIRSILSGADWKAEWFAKDETGRPFLNELECETQPCGAVPELKAAFESGLKCWVKELPPEVKRIHLRAADGYLYCRCEKCRQIPAREQWYPYFQVFVDTVRELRPDLKVEGDVYNLRYNLPQNQEAYLRSGRIMFDTFLRHTYFPLGSCGDRLHACNLKYLAEAPLPDARTPNEYLLRRLEDWNRNFPGRVYIHENAMKQSLLGNFQYATLTYLKDLETYRRLGLEGVCYEAFEPGYSAFAEMFEVLSRALDGEGPRYEPNELDMILPSTDHDVFCNDLNFPLEKYIADPYRLKQARLFRRTIMDYNLQVFREYAEFSLEHEDEMDFIFIIFFLAKAGLHRNLFRFSGLSESAEAMLNHRKLWDFMEKIPLEEDPRQYCRELVIEILSKAVP
ncbi:MAG: hypothetical protein IJH79_07910 [Lentisphaeria bacterium]|nr:hypothetical protein [Lentisphaeria bacterium]